MSNHTQSYNISYSLCIQRMYVEVTRIMHKIAYYTVTSRSRVLCRQLRRSFNREILPLLLHPKFHCPDHKLQPMVSILGRFNEIHTAIPFVEFVLVSFSHIFVDPQCGLLSSGSPAENFYTFFIASIGMCTAHLTLKKKLGQASY